MYIAHFYLLQARCKFWSYSGQTGSSAHKIVIILIIFRLLIFLWIWVLQVLLLKNKMFKYTWPSIKQKFCLFFFNSCLILRYSSRKWKITSSFFLLNDFFMPHMWFHSWTQAIFFLSVKLNAEMNFLFFPMEFIF